ncbi:NAD(P)-dependent oxidoreductase [Bifidobacterium sp. ESL0690]|uniref:NAD(P)-dependent oxidoreductase n=1 Tax=Bifidobacterium sp. ESL0690 TaxID=2983214 RepID=UPI0023FA3EF5|nr:NAD(P)-dependent oxidoreductase [Bifidobacterium sp. ESL0690]WEV47382.1 NAD(P)-dependent oxidoreductase [Bifidobacterium sp. ESL0690]
MHILICDYPDSMMPDHRLEMQTLKNGLGDDAVIDVLEYDDSRHDEFLKAISKADALLTAFVNVDASVMDAAPNLKVVSLNSTGYDRVDLKEATKRGIGVCPVGEYCTTDVAEAAVAFVLALHKRIKAYGQQIDRDHEWDFSAFPAWPRLQDQSVGIFGFGKIGKATSRKLMGLVKDISVCDPYISNESALAAGVTMKDKDELLATSDVIINIMNLNDTNVGCFNADAFAAMQRKPLFVNVSRGLCVDESALLEALDSGQIRGYAADVLSDETPDLANNALVGRDNVLLTPHSAFYSTTSMEALQRLSCENIVHFLKGEKERVFKLVNAV